MDIKLNYHESGEGEPLILLHGNGGSYREFDRQTAFFSDSYRVIAIDTRGHGGSPRGDMPLSIRRFAEDLFGFMTEKGIGKANILGFSDGGNVALTFALDHPEMVSKLVLNGANLFPAGVKREFQSQVEEDYRSALLAAQKDPEAAARAELLGLMVNEPDISPDSLSALGMPVLVIAGTEDLIEESHTRLIAASIKNARLVFIQGGHFLINTNPGPFNSAVRDFLDSQAPVSQALR